MKKYGILLLLIFKIFLEEHTNALSLLSDELGRKLLATNGTECDIDAIIEKCIKKEREIQFSKRRTEFLKMFVTTVKSGKIAEVLSVDNWAP